MVLRSAAVSETMKLFYHHYFYSGRMEQRNIFELANQSDQTDGLMANRV
jgi:hypothetical protein